MDKIFELQQIRNEAIAKARAFAEGTFDADAQASYESAMNEVERIDKQIASIENARRLGETAESGKAPEVADRKSMFANALTGDASKVAAFMNSYTLGTAATAGALTAPMEFVEELIKGIDNECFMRTISHMTPRLGAAQTLGFPYRKTAAADAVWKTEVAEAGEESTLEYGRREFKPNRLPKLIRLSRTLVNHSNIAEQVVRDELAASIAATLESAYMTGDGDAKPLGIFTASNNGIAAGRDVTQALTSADAFIEAKYALKGQYHGNAQWVMHRDIVKLIAKLKDSTNQYIWQPSAIAGQPDTLLGMKVHMSEYAPNTTTAGSYVAVLGDFSKYWICDAEELAMQILTEKYATTNEIGYLATYFGDGAPVVGEAFARIKVAS